MATVSLDGIITAISVLAAVVGLPVHLDGILTSVSTLKANRSTPWISTLPQFPLLAGYTDGEADNLIRSQIAVSISKIRSRSGATPINVTFPVLLTHAQKLVLDVFYDVELKGGIKVFVLKLPGDQETSRLRFSESIAYRAITHDFWSAQLSFETVKSNDVIGVELILEDEEE